MKQLQSLFQILCVISFTSLISCGTEKPKLEESTTTEAETTMPRIPVPNFSADSAYAFIQKQVDFGPRIPGTKAHADCAAWLEEKLKSYLPEVIVQKGTASTFDQKKYEVKNIIGSFNPQIGKRVLLCAHWDTRPFADRDEGGNLNKKFDGANDGASGVGVLLEIARQLSIAKPDIGSCGYGVRLIRDRDDLAAYLARFPRDQQLMLQQQMQQRLQQQQQHPPQQQPHC